jgi:hypothetical protein
VHPVSRVPYVLHTVSFSSIQTGKELIRMSYSLFLGMMVKKAVADDCDDDDDDD